jgi:hypothetical protein
VVKLPLRLMYFNSVKITYCWLQWHCELRICLRPSLSEIVGSNPTRSMELCVVMSKSLRGADHSSRGVLPSVVCLSVIMNPQQRRGLGLEALLRHGENTGVFIMYVLP